MKVSAVVVLSAFALASAHAEAPKGPPNVAAAGAAHWADLKPVVVPAHAFAETPKLSDISAGMPALLPETEGAFRKIPIRYIHRSLKAPGAPRERDPVIQSSAPSLNIPSPDLTFEGVNNHCNCSPPDTNGDIGPSNYVQTVNVHFQVFNKFTGAAQTGILSNNVLFTGLGLCGSTDDGDPIVLYDHLADRWLIAQFANASSSVGPFYMSVA